MSKLKKRKEVFFKRNYICNHTDRLTSFRIQKSHIEKLRLSYGDCERRLVDSKLNKEKYVLRQVLQNKVC